MIVRFWGGGGREITRDMKRRISRCLERGSTLESRLGDVITGAFRRGVGLSIERLSRCDCSGCDSRELETVYGCVYRSVDGKYREKRERKVDRAEGKLIW